jgi:hypothetical protein
MLAFYVAWHEILGKHIPKTLRYSLGVKIDGLFAEVLEAIALAQFSPPPERATHLDRAIGKNDTLKFMLYALYELKGIDEKKLILLSEKAEEIGRMLYGWKRGTENKQRKNPPP